LGNGDFNAEYTEGAEDDREDTRDVAGVNEAERLGVEVREGLGRRKWPVASDEWRVWEWRVWEWRVASWGVLWGWAGAWGIVF